MKRIILCALLPVMFFNLFCCANQIKYEIKKYEKNINNNIDDKAINYHKLGELENATIFLGKNLCV